MEVKFNKQLDKEVYILGELHGASINPTVILKLLKMLDIKAVAFEWPASWQLQLNQPEINYKKLLAAFNTLKDGRALPEHIVLIKRLRKRKVKIFAMDTYFSTDSFNWNARDKTMAHRVIAIRKSTGNAPLLIVVGRLHARKYSFYLNKKMYIPLVSHLQQEKVSFCIRYGSGKILNLGEKLVIDPVAKKITGKVEDIIIYKSRSKYFDFDVFVPSTTKSS